MSALDEIAALVEIGRRAPGSDAERRAARHLEARLRQMGRRAETEALDVWPRWPLAYALCATLSALGSVLSVSLPAPGAALALAGALLLAVDAGFLIPLARRPLGRRASQNVISWDRRDRPGRIVLVAHYDAGRGGLALGRRLRRLLGARPLLWAQLAVLACCAPRLAGSEGIALSVVQFVPTVVLIVAVALLLDIALSPTRAGENDNASGVALALRLAERFSTEGPEHFGVHVLFSGSQKAMAAGTRGFIARHRRELDKESTLFVNLDEIGSGTLRHARKEGPLFALKTRLRLTELGDAPSFVNRSPSDGYAAVLRGYPVVTLSGSKSAGVDAEAMWRAEAFCAALIERLDAELGPALSSSG
ncbi:MAG: M28 family peptidase [Thermoleophilaceae bacterium]